MGRKNAASQAEKKKSGTIRFEIRAEKTDKDGKSPVRLIYQVKGQRKYYNTGQKLLSASWDPKNQQAIYIDRKTAKKLDPVPNFELLLTAGEATTFNGKLGDLQKQIESIEKRFEMDSIIYSAEMVIDKLNEIRKPKNKKEAPSNVLFEFIDKYILDHANTREPGSLIVYRSLKSHLQAFQQETKPKSHLIK